MNEHARRYALPHFRPVRRPKRRLITGGFAKNMDCLVCGMRLPESHKDTIQYFHGDCRRFRVAMRKELS